MIFKLQLISLAVGLTGIFLDVLPLLFIGGIASLGFSCKILLEGGLHPFLVVFVFGYFIFTEGALPGLMYAGLVNLILALTLIPLIQRFFDSRSRKGIESQGKE
ncbi:MAG: hypothetical protein JW971_04675 [Synergistales bacterium]|nr:hypothetical protein [Synergistales bacterium]